MYGLGDFQMLQELMKLLNSDQPTRQQEVAQPQPILTKNEPHLAAVDDECLPMNGRQPQRSAT